MARRKGAGGPAVISTAEAEFAEIIAWYEHQLATTAPPTDLPWEPKRIGPTWEWDERTGWLLPDLTLGWRVLAWCGKWLRDNRGQPWQFTPEQTRFILWYFAVDESGAFVYHSGVLQRLKGWGKDPIAACLSMAAMFAEVEFDHFDRAGRPVGRENPVAWVQIVATSQEQTKNTMKLFPSLVPAETRLRYGVQIGKLNVFGLGDSRQIEAVTSSPTAVEGGRATQVIRSETQFWNSSNSGHDMAGAIEGNAAKSEGGAARMLDICNAYRPGEDSVGERVREAWEATQGEEATTADFGLLYDSLEAPPNAPLTAEAAPDVVRSIAGDSTWLDTKPNGRIVKSILNPANSASESRRKWYNQIGATEDAWLDPKHWDLCEHRREIAADERVVLFFDGSKSGDASALIGCALADGYLFRVGIWQPKPGNEINRDAVDERVRDAFHRYRVCGLWGDPSDARDDETGELFWEPYFDRWAQMYRKKLQRLPAVKTGTNAHLVTWDMRNPRHQAQFTAAAERFTTDVKDTADRVAGGEQVFDISHDGHELFRQHVRNAHRRPGKFGVGLGKEHRESKRKVDAAVCAVGARMMRRAALEAGISPRSVTRKAVLA